MRAALLVLCALLAGCASSGFATRGARNAELSWLAIHAIDTAQTVTIARSPGCLYEANPLAVKVYGTKHPSVSRVLVTNTAMGALHWQLGAWLDRGTERAMGRESDKAGLWYIGRGLFYGLSFLGSGSAVIGNVRLGVKPLKEMC